MQKVWRLLALATLILALSPSRMRAQDVNTFILQSPSLAQAQAACAQYGLTFVSIVRDPGTYLVQASSSLDPHQLAEWTEDDPNVAGIELNKHVKQGKGQTAASISVPSSVPPTTAVTDKTLSALFGATTWAAYAQQPAIYSTNVYSAAIQSGFKGQGIIAIIDTGVDEQNPILAPVVVPGYDFTRNAAGYANDSADLDQSTAHILHQSTAHILFGYQTVQLNESSVAILDADTAVALQGTTLPNDFGHGTMVAGLIHLVAPGAQIMPLKAFNADGTANTSDIIRAIYYATDNGATVINMSFGFPAISDALMKAVNYASRKGVICVASVGNDGSTNLMYPAAFGNVVGVASVNAQNQTSAFSNSGADMVVLAAPGENLVTTYPGNHYAAVSGTSFSAALVSGAANILLNQGVGGKHKSYSQFQEPDIARALKHAVPCVTDGSMGGGCMDMAQAIAYIQSMVVPATATSQK